MKCPKDHEEMKLTDSEFQHNVWSMCPSELYSDTYKETYKCPRCETVVETSQTVIVKPQYADLE